MTEGQKVLYWVLRRNPESRSGMASWSGDFFELRVDTTLYRIRYDEVRYVLARLVLEGELK